MYFFDAIQSISLLPDCVDFLKQSKVLMYENCSNKKLTLSLDAEL